MDENQSPPVQPQPPIQTHRKKLATRTKVALWLIIGPSMLVALALILFISSSLLGPEPKPLPASCTNDSLSLSDDTSKAQAKECTDTLFGEQSKAQIIFNIVLFIAGALGVLAWLPGLIIGFTLLAKKPKAPPTPFQ
jgi:hypothetical protein